MEPVPMITIIILGINNGIIFTFVACVPGVQLLAFALTARCVFQRSSIFPAEMWFTVTCKNQEALISMYTGKENATLAHRFCSENIFDCTS